MGIRLFSVGGGGSTVAGGCDGGLSDLDATGVIGQVLASPAYHWYGSQRPRRISKGRAAVEPQMFQSAKQPTRRSLSSAFRNMRMCQIAEEPSFRMPRRPLSLRLELVMFQWRLVDLIPSSRQEVGVHVAKAPIPEGLG